MTQARLEEHISALLEDLVGRVKARVAGAVGSSRDDAIERDGGVRLYATFLATPDGDAISVTVLIRPLGAGVECTADCVREGTVIDEMPVLSVAGLEPAAAAAAILRAVSEFVRAQEDHVVVELQRAS